MTKPTTCGIPTLAPSGTTAGAVAKALGITQVSASNPDTPAGAGISGEHDGWTGKLTVISGNSNRAILRPG